MMGDGTAGNTMTDVEPVIINDPEQAVVDAFTAKAWSEYPVETWPDACFDPWTTQTGPFELFAESNGHIGATDADGVECPDIYPVTVHEDGTISGFYALEGQCHLGYMGQGICVPATLDQTFDGFHETPVTLDSGATLMVGFGTALKDHVSEMLPAAQVVEAQSDISALVAVLRAYYYPGAGIYLAGHLMSDVDTELVNKMRLGYPSGHWAIENNAHSLRIFHWVLKPGFAPQWYVPKETGVTASRTRLGADKTLGDTMSKNPNLNAVIAAYKIVSEPTGLRWDDRVKLPDGAFGAVSATYVDSSGAAYVVVRVETDGQLGDSIIYRADEVEATGEKYEYTYENEDAAENAVVASEAAVTAGETVVPAARALRPVKASAFDVYSGDVWEAGPKPDQIAYPGDQVTLSSGETAMVQEIEPGVGGVVYEVIVDVSGEGTQWGAVLTATADQITPTGNVYTLVSWDDGWSDYAMSAGRGVKRAVRAGLLTSKPCCKKCAETGGSCGGAKTAAELPATETPDPIEADTELPDVVTSLNAMNDAVRALDEKVTAELASLGDRITVLEGGDTAADDSGDTQTGDGTDAEGMTARSARFPASVLQLNKTPSE
jgi:hypothetical protein